jgi:hypothetical protein
LPAVALTAVLASACTLLASLGRGYVTELGDPLANFHGYQAADWSGGWPIAVPFAGIVDNFRNRQNIASSTMLAAKTAHVALHILLLGGTFANRERRMRFFQ